MGKSATLASPKIKRKPVVLVCHNGVVNGNRRIKIFEVDRRCTLESNVLRELFSEMVRIGNIDTRPKILEEVLNFCYRRASIKLLHLDPQVIKIVLEHFDSGYFKDNSTSVTDLAEYLRAACDLQIKSLLDITSNAIANNLLLFPRKDTRDILKIFHLKEYFTTKEMNEHRQENSWAYGSNIEEMNMDESDDYDYD